MFKKTIISEFFTTINVSIFFRSIAFLTYKLPFIRYGKSVGLFENKLLKYIGVYDSKVVSFYNGRSAIFHCLKMIGLNNKDEVIVSGYTCISVSNAVLQAGAKIIYSDINKNNLGLNLLDLKKNITKHTKVIIVQHTFGKPSNIKDIIKIAKENNILVIEDCAHSLGSKYNGKKLGFFGDFSIFSSGRDKVISGVTGGFLIINNKKYFKRIEDIKKQLKMPSYLLVLRNLNYNIFAYFSYKTYNFLGLGKVIIFLSRKLKLITEILSNKEKKCKFKEFNFKLPNSLASLAYNNFKELKQVTIHRRSIGDYYSVKLNNKYFKVLFTAEKNEKFNYFRFPIITKSNHINEKLYTYAKKHNILLGKSWSGNNIVPLGSNLKNAGYKQESCPVSENISNRILTLPNHRTITPQGAKKIVKILNNF